MFSYERNNRTANTIRVVNTRNVIRKTAKPADIYFPSALGAINYLPRLEFITLAPDCLDAPVLFPVGILDLFSDTLDMNINST